MNHPAFKTRRTLNASGPRIVGVDRYNSNEEIMTGVS